MFQKCQKMTNKGQYHTWKRRSPVAVPELCAELKQRIYDNVPLAIVLWCEVYGVHSDLKFPGPSSLQLRVPSLHLSLQSAQQL